MYCIYVCVCYSEFGKELDRTLGEKQKLQMEIEEQKAAMREIEIREVKLKLEAAQREEDLKVKINYNIRNLNSSCISIEI